MDREKNRETFVKWRILSRLVVVDFFPRREGGVDEFLCKNDLLEKALFKCVIFHDQGKSATYDKKQNVLYFSFL